MSKEDIIPVYSLGIVSENNERGICLISNDMREVLSTIDSIKLEKEKEIFIQIEYEGVAIYLEYNQDNITLPSAELLAKQHGFYLNEINFHS